VSPVKLRSVINAACHKCMRPDRSFDVNDVAAEIIGPPWRDLPEVARDLIIRGIDAVMMAPHEEVLAELEARANPN
jgi:hypothetical protein